ncbi:hypothetical protein BDF19DRAFT_411404 [Syncephalis fuscata]|nr:hypothetical protein BDF19DRAFT_411404 [Syncephalis fuscata]
MCSLQDNELPVEVPRLAASKLTGNKLRDRPCAKCKTAPPVVIIRHDGFCSECFQRNVGSKFRTVIGKLRTPVEDAGGKASILLAYSGGPASRVLLQLADDFNNANRSQRFAAYTICHVDESALFDDNPSMKAASTDFLEGIRKITNEFSFEFEQVPLESVFASYTNERSPESATTVMMTPTRRETGSIFAESFETIQLQTSLSDVDKLRLLFKQAESLSAREDLLFYLRQRVLHSVAVRKNCSAIWTAETATRIAIRTISNVAKGRGLTLPLETGAQSDLDKDIAFWRPIRDVLAKEVGLYVRYRHLSMPSFPILLSTRRPAKASIGRLSEAVVIRIHCRIRARFVSTANTVTRTVGKLTPSANVDYERRCALCRMPADRDPTTWLELCTVTTMGRLNAALPDAQKLSNGIATISLNTNDQSEQCCNNNRTTNNTYCNDGSCSQSNLTEQDSFDLMPALCYGCLVTLRDFPVTNEPVKGAASADSVDTVKTSVAIPLPTYVEHAARQRLDQMALREKIADFLIEDDDDDDDDDNDDDCDKSK